MKCKFLLVLVIFTLSLISAKSNDQKILVVKTFNEVTGPLTNDLPSIIDEEIFIIKSKHRVTEPSSWYGKYREKNERDNIKSKYEYVITSKIKSDKKENYSIVINFEVMKSDKMEKPFIYKEYGEPDKNKIERWLEFEVVKQISNYIEFGNFLPKIFVQKLQPNIVLKADHANICNTEFERKIANYNNAKNPDFLISTIPEATEYLFQSSVYSIEDKRIKIKIAFIINDEICHCYSKECNKDDNIGLKMQTKSLFETMEKVLPVIKENDPFGGQEKATFCNDSTCL